MRQSLFLWLLVCVLATSVGAQTTRRIEGFIRDSTGQPLDFANVMALSANTKRIIAFARTDDKGFFALSVSTDSTALRLKATLLGWQATEMPLPIPDPAAPVLKQDITLYANTVALREVVVRERLPPIRARNDTTEWRVSAFSDSTETTVEDLLRKLPGVEVGERGEIKVNGKSVEKILIEGDDLFGNDYTLASRNIRANNLQAVQAIDRYQENATLKGVKSSDALVLNLKIKEDRKRILSGNATVGAGWGGEAKYYAHGNLFSFSRRSKTFLFGDLNNVGFNAMADAEFFMNGGGLEAMLEQRRPELGNESLLLLPQIQDWGLPSATINPARAGLVMLTHISNFGPAWKFKTSGLLFGDRLRQTYFSDNRFRLPGGADFTLREDRVFQRRNRLGSAQAELVYQSAHLRTRLKLLSQYRQGDATHEVDLRRALEQETEEIPQWLSDRPATWLNQLEMTRKMGEKSAWQAEAQYIRLDRPQTLRADWQNFAGLLGLDSAARQITQQSRSLRWQAKALTRWITNNNSGQWTAEGSLIWQQQHLNSTAALRKELTGQEFALAPDYQNQLALRRPMLVADGSWQRSFGRLGLTTNATLRHIQGSSTEFEQVVKQSFALFTAKLRATYQLTPLAQLTANYAYTPRLPDSDNLHTGLIWTDYGSLNRGLNDQSPIVNQSFRLGYRYRNEPKLLFVNASAMLLDNRNNFGSALAIDPLFNLSAAFRPVAARQYLANFQIDKFISALSSRIALSLAYSGFQNVNRLNGTIARNNFFQTRTVRMEYGSAFDVWVNFFLTSALTHSTARVRSDGRDQLTNATGWRSTWRTIIRPTKQASIDVSLHQINNYFNGRRNGQFFALDGAVQIFTAKNFRRSLKFSVHNILNARVFEQVSVSDFADSRDGQGLVPRFFLLTYDWTL